MTEVKAQELRLGDVVLGVRDRPDCVVRAAPRMVGESVTIDVCNVADMGVRRMARSNRRYVSPIYTITRDFDELVKVEREGGGGSAVRADQLGEWTGYRLGDATIESVKVHSSQVVVNTVGPADGGR